MSAAVTLRNVAVDYGRTRALSNVDLTIEEGETLALLGPSGSGKTTLVNAVAGFVAVSEGEIEIGGRKVSTPRSTTPPDRRGVGVVFQNYALWPHLDAVDIVAYPLRRRGVAKAEARQEALRLMRRLGIGELGGRRPHQLSGGQQQRVGLARALAREATVYLLDEPTAHLDAAVAAAAQAEMRAVLETGGAAVLHSTHDATEALALADRVALLRDGGVVQVGSPIEVYSQPKDRWVAVLTGPVSVLGGHWDGSSVTIEGVPVKVSDHEHPVGPVEVMVRPDWVRPGGSLRGTVVERLYRGAHTDYVVGCRAGTFTARLGGPPSLESGAELGWEIEAGWILP